MSGHQTLVSAFDAAHEEMLRAFLRLARANPDVARDKIESTRSAMTQIVMLETPDRRAGDGR